MYSKEEFSKSISDYFQEITKENFNSKYDGIMALILDFNANGLKAGEIIELLNASYKNEFNDYKEEVLIDAIARINGDVSPHLRVHLEW